MSYIGIGYIGTDGQFLREMVDRNTAWLKGDRQPRFYGDQFIIMYDSNTAREFAHRCRESAEQNEIVVYPVGRPFEMP